MAKFSVYQSDTLKGVFFALFSSIGHREKKYSLQCMS